MSIGNQLYSNLFNNSLILIAGMYITGDYFWDSFRYKVGIKNTRIIMAIIRALFFSLLLHHDYSASPVQSLDLEFVAFALVIEVRGTWGGFSLAGIMMFIYFCFMGTSNLFFLKTIVVMMLVLGDLAIRKYVTTRWRRWLVMSIYGLTVVFVSYLYQLVNEKQLGFTLIGHEINHLPVFIYFLILAPIASFVCTGITFHIYDTRQQLRKLEVRSMTDDLTQLYNVRGYNLFMAQFESKAHAFGKKVSLLVLDLDKFKTINDTYGHTVGDEILQHFASILKEYQNENIYACRKGGDEFVLVMFDVDVAQALHVASLLHEQISTSSFAFHDGKKISCDASIGVACYPDTTSNFKNLFDSADKNLYSKKDRMVQIMPVSNTAI